MGRRNNKKRLGYASGEIPTGPGQTQGQTGGNNRGGFDQRNVYRPQQQHGRPPYPRPGFPNPQQQPQSTPPLGPRTIDSGWRGATAAAVPPSNPPQMTSTFQNQQNFNSNFRPRPPPQQIHQQQQQQQNHRTQPQHQYQHHPHNQPRPFNQASSYYPSGPSRAPASRSNNNSSSSSRLDDLNYNSGVGSTNGGHSNGSYQDHSRRTLDSTLDAGEFVLLPFLPCQRCFLHRSPSLSLSLFVPFTSSARFRSLVSLKPCETEPTSFLALNCLCLLFRFRP